jgi:hypothetical protein
MRHGPGDVVSRPRLPKEQLMGLLKTGLAGAAAWKWGGGIIGTILVFVLVFWLLGFIF